MCKRYNTTAVINEKVFGIRDIYSVKQRSEISKYIADNYFLPVKNMTQHMTISSNLVLC